ncbi:MAG: hypothetical protein H6738_14865 [Alphaproteobacteria bacterium]|nr:hypothetical protein [Alphaproteobacteria bacterium]MCB9698058.1 hypothetical protein [Alphaproteobacteria bacterium]
MLLLIGASACAPPRFGPPDPLRPAIDRSLATCEWVERPAELLPPVVESDTRRRFDAKGRRFQEFFDTRADDGSATHSSRDTTWEGECPVVVDTTDSRTGPSDGSSVKARDAAECDRHDQRVHVTSRVDQFVGVAIGASTTQEFFWEHTYEHGRLASTEDVDEDGASLGVRTELTWDGGQLVQARQIYELGETTAANLGDDDGLLVNTARLEWDGDRLLSIENDTEIPFPAHSVTTYLYDGDLWLGYDSETEILPGDEGGQSVGLTFRYTYDDLEEFPIRSTSTVEGGEAYVTDIEVTCGMYLD